MVGGIPDICSSFVLDRVDVSVFVHSFLGLHPG